MKIRAMLVLILLTLSLLNGCENNKEDLLNTETKKDIITMHTNKEEILIENYYFYGVNMAVSKAEIFNDIGEENIVKSNEDNISEIFNNNKWAEIKYNSLDGIESLSNIVFKDALSSTISFEDLTIKEYSIWWEFSNLSDLDIKYKEIKLKVESDFGLLYEQEKSLNDVLPYSYRTIYDNYVVNLIQRKMSENNYLLKLSCIKSANPEKFQVGNEILDNDISYSVPDGWITNENENSPYNIIFGPRKDNFNPNISIIKFVELLELKEILQSAKDELCDANIRIIASNLNVSTPLNNNVASIIYEYELEQLYIYQYYIQKGNSTEFLAVTCGELSKNDFENMEKFDNFVKSIVFK